SGRRASARLVESRNNRRRVRLALFKSLWRGRHTDRNFPAKTANGADCVLPLPLYRATVFHVEPGGLTCKSSAFLLQCSLQPLAPCPAWRRGPPTPSRPRLRRPPLLPRSRRAQACGTSLTRTAS